MRTTYTQACGCVIHVYNAYSDDSSAEIGEWCNLHASAGDLLKAGKMVMEWWNSLPLNWKAPNHDAGLESVRAVRLAVTEAERERERLLRTT